MRICISSGHSTKCRGANDIIDEVEEATAVADDVAICLRDAGVHVEVFHDTVSDDQQENLNRIVDWHNQCGNRDLDVSVHFNCSDEGTTSRPIGVEVLYVTQGALAERVSQAISDVSTLIDRGPKYRNDLFFLNQTHAPAILLEICFVNSETDVRLYRTYFAMICEAIAEAIVGEAEVIPEPEPAPGDAYLFHATGACSHFGGPDDTGVSASEGLAFHYEINETNQHLFLPLQPPGTSGLARRLNARAVHYLAVRWDYSVTPKEMLANSGYMALVTNTRTGMAQTAFPADWGPNDATGRVADLSPALMRDLDLETDQDVEVAYPWGAEETS